MSMTRNVRTLSLSWRSALAAVAGVCLAVSSVAPAQAAESAPPDFHATPAQLPAANGDLVRQEPSTFYLDPARLVEPAAAATRIMYRTTNAAGQPVATTGTVLVSQAPWLKSGPRPLVVFAPGTQGMGDQCAPSRQLPMGTQYEAASLSSLVNAGYSVVAPDYVGLGTPGTHTYMNRTDQAHAVLDAARDAERAGLAGISATTPVAMVGYSQGGGATAAAAELASTYAPELRIKSAWAGAPPADLQATGKLTETGALAGLTLYTMAAAEQYGVPVRDYLNADGVARLERAEQGCVTDSIVNDAFMQMGTLSNGGRTSDQLMAEPRWRATWRSSESVRRGATRHFPCALRTAPPTTWCPTVWGENWLSGGALPVPTCPSRPWRVPRTSADTWRVGRP